MSFQGDYVGDAERVAARVRAFFANFKEDMQLAGDAAARGIVQTTLAGIGERDEAFAPYSAEYKALLAAVGGKQRGVVDLRGIFYPDGKGPRGMAALRKFQARAARRRDGAGRSAFVQVAAISAQPGALGVSGRTFFARTKLTRPQRGLTDPLSEMSLDLLKVEATDRGFKIVYRPRKKPYMIAHQKNPPKGTPRRVWFTLDKKAVGAGVRNSMKQILRARAAWFNTGA